MTVMELLVAVGIISIAIAGLTELAWVNTVWNTRLFNKIDNHYAARLFLQRIGKDVRNASLIQTTSTGTGLTLIKPSFDSNGFRIPTSGSSTTVSYTVTADTPPVDPATGRNLYKISCSNPAIDVLHGVVGPTTTANQTAVFQYVQNNTATISNDASTGKCNGVLINLELQRLDYGGSRSYSDKSTSIFGIRDQFILRNALLQWK